MSTEEKVVFLENKVTNLEVENRRLHDTVTFLTQQLYGRKTEKTSSLGLPGQMSLFDEIEQTCSNEVQKPEPKGMKSSPKKKHPGHKKELLETLPHEKILITINEDQKLCDVCGNELVRVGEELIRSEVEYIPAQLKVIDYYQETYECLECRKNSGNGMIKSHVPNPLILHSYASASLVGSILHQKFELAVPFYRQEKEWETLGLALTRETMSNWAMIVYRDWLDPIVQVFRNELLKAQHIHADETPVQVLNEPGRKNTTESYMWLYCSGIHEEHQVRIFDYKPGRSGKYPREFLQGFKGFLHTDAYAGYEKVSGITRCFCWSHLRRYFVEALPKDTASAEGTIAAKGIHYINKLFEYEKEFTSLTKDERKAKRSEQEVPHLEAFWSWIKDKQGEVLPKSKLGEAFRYALAQEVGLMNYLKDGDTELSNNLAENSIRPFTVGRKNWLFSGSPKGANTSAGIYTIVETAKANQINPQKYIEYLLSTLPNIPFLQQKELLLEFLPWNETIKNRCK